MEGAEIEALLQKERKWNKKNLIKAQRIVGTDCRRNKHKERANRKVHMQYNNKLPHKINNEKKRSKRKSCYMK